MARADGKAFVDDEADFFGEVEEADGWHCWWRG